MTLATAEAAFAACEAAGLEPLKTHDHQFEHKFAVFPPGASRYMDIYGAQSFVDWCNIYFGLTD